MGHKKRKKPHGPQTLEPTIKLGNGRVARRCQAKAKGTGKQCRNPARVGFDVCSSHGAGTRKRVEKGDKQHPGRPLEHGLYSERARDLTELTQEILMTDQDLANTDREMATNKAIVLTLLKHIPSVEVLATKIEAAISEQDDLDFRERVRVLELCAEAFRLMLRLHKANASNVYQAKLRAETEAKQAEQRAAEIIASIAPLARDIFVDMMSEEAYEVFYERFRREVLGKVGIRGDKKALN